MAFDAWQKWAPYTDKRLTSQIELKTKEVGEIVAQGEFIGSAAELKKLLRPLRKAGLPTSIWIKEVPYIKAVEFLIYQVATSLPFEKDQGHFWRDRFHLRRFSE